MKLIAIHPFSWAHRGVQVEQFDEGAEIETEDQDLIEVSAREGWTKVDGDSTAVVNGELPDDGGPADPDKADETPTPGAGETPPPGADESPAPKPGRKAKAK